jgi:hypothetical protein
MSLVAAVIATPIYGHDRREGAREWWRARNAAQDAEGNLVAPPHLTTKSRKP